VPKTQRRAVKRTREALQLVMVGGLSAYAAAQQIGVHPSAISRARKRIEANRCPTCHRAL
jgi:DNA-binding transcriptional regulator YdaS (Cro superfamily)